MPELPDVEHFRRYFDATALHQRIRHIHVPGAALLEGTTPQALGRSLSTAVFQATARHGKYLFALASNGKCLVLHFGMTGKLEYSRCDTALPGYAQLEIDFESDYRLAYISPRKLGCIGLANSPADWSSRQGLGPDALEISAGAFLRQTGTAGGQVKPWLMDQHHIAGIGNYYSDEILFQSHIHPARSLRDLSDQDRMHLFRNMRRILLMAIARNANPAALPRSYLLPHRVEGGRCPRCAGRLGKLKLAGRTAFYCPNCQPA